MTDVEQAVNRLFAKYKPTREVEELRAEVLSNLHARLDDEMARGVSPEVALDSALESLGDVNLLVEGTQRILINPLKRQLIQIALLYTLIPWVLTIPCRFVQSGMWVNTFLTLLVVVEGVVYITLLLRRQDDKHARVVHLPVLQKLMNISWILWGAYVGLSTISTLGARFASNLWFHRTIAISGPYMLADLMISVLLPFVTVFIPLYVVRVHRLIQAQEVS